MLVKQKPYDERGTVAKSDNMRSQWLNGKYLGLLDVIPQDHLVYVEGPCSSTRYTSEPGYMIQDHPRKNWRSVWCQGE